MERLISLTHYDLVEGPPERSLAGIVRTARRLLGSSMAAVSLSAHDRQIYKVTVGMPACELPRKGTLCDLVLDGPSPVVIRDTLLDPRFSTSSFVIGQPHVRFYAGVPLCTSGGHGIGALCTMDTRPRDIGDGEIEGLSDLAELVMSFLELRRLASTDGLTGASLRRGFHDAARQVLSLALRYDQRLAVVAFDIDHFKAINDGHGHAIGDAVLRDCVAVCRRHLRSSDIVARTGGEEFAVLLPLTGADAGMIVAEKLRAAIASLTVATPAGPLRVTASFGVAELLHRTPDLDALLHRADTALYAAKGSGRNRCIRAPSDDEDDDRRRAGGSGRGPEARSVTPA